MFLYKKYILIDIDLVTAFSCERMIRTICNIN